MNEPIQNKTLQPPGLLPKHIQSWILVGLAVLMVLIMWLTGSKKPPSAAKATTQTPPAEAPLEVNQTRINELQSRIAELQRQQMISENALTQQARPLGVAPQGSPATPQQLPAMGNSERAEDAIDSEHKKREYLSLFASNVALSYRESSPEAERAGRQPTPIFSPSDHPESGGLAQLLKKGEPVALSETTALHLSPGPDSEAGKEEAPRPAVAPTDILSAAAGKTYLLLEGTILETVLINRLEGDFSGPVLCLLTTNVYSHDRQHLLIPSGTKLLGEARKVENLGQTRLALVFHRLVMPDGYSLNLDQFKGLDQIGDTGLSDQVNHHYLRLFGVSLAIGALGAVAEAGTGSALTASGTDIMRQGFASTTAQSASQILDRFLNILPTITIREGHRVKVYLSGDLALPDYAKHTMPSDF
jgi:type IV secretion system protein TrbI